MRNDADIRTAGTDPHHRIVSKAEEVAVTIPFGAEGGEAYDVEPGLPHSPAGHLGGYLRG